MPQSPPSATRWCRWAAWPRPRTWPTSTPTIWWWTAASAATSSAVCPASARSPAAERPMPSRGARLGLLCLPRSVASAVADARLAEDVRFSPVGVADSQSVFREMYATMALCAQATRRLRIGPSVTNAITRHPAVAASGIATVDEIAPGRAFFGIGSGDSAILNLAERPSTLADLRAYIETVRALHSTGETTWRGRMVRLTWAKRAVPIYLSAEGPRTLELAGEIADG